MNVSKTSLVLMVALSGLIGAAIGRMSVDPSGTAKHEAAPTDSAREMRDSLNSLAATPQLDSSFATTSLAAKLVAAANSEHK